MNMPLRLDLRRCHLQRTIYGLLHPLLFPLELPPFSSPPSLMRDHVRNENSSPPFRTPAPPVPWLPPPPPPLPRFGPRSMPLPIIHVREDSSTSSPFGFPSRISAWEYFFPNDPSPPAEQRLDKETTVNSSVLKVKISEAYKRDDPHCPICKEEYEVGEEAAKLRCFHAFHSECVLPWLDNHKTCPVCRRKVEAPPPDEWEINILEVGVTMEVPQLPITLLEEEIEENNNENVNWDEAEIRDIEETHEVDDNNSTSDSDEAGYDSARDELDESHG